uniref:Uncharacterized protein n=1 Tax=viral metagenome TaxID=1070528 RepID=A0A6C0BKV4_9ZZZZ
MIRSIVLRYIDLRSKSNQPYMTSLDEVMLCLLFN